MRIEFIFDYRSPYSYLANTQLKGLGAEVDYKPVDIVAVMKKVNNQPSPLCPSKARYAGIDAARWARLYGVGFSPNAALLKALREGAFDGKLLCYAALAAQTVGAFDQLHDGLLAAVWNGTDDLVTEEGRKAFLERQNLAAGDLWEQASDPAIQRRMAEQVQETADRGVFGVRGLSPANQPAAAVR